MEYKYKGINKYNKNSLKCFKAYSDKITLIHDKDNRVIIK